MGKALQNFRKAKEEDFEELEDKKINRKRSVTDLFKTNGECISLTHLFPVFLNMQERNCLWLGRSGCRTKSTQPAGV